MPEDNFIIRYATLSDAALLTDLGRRAFAETFGAANTPENMADYLNKSFYLEKQQEELSAPGSVFLIAESEEEAFGFARLLSDSTETCITGQHPIELVRIYLLPNWIGKGEGSKLMQACLDEAWGRGHDVIWLGVWEENARAIRFYQKWGFEVVGSHTFALGDDLQRDLILQRNLG